MYTCFLDASKAFDRVNHWTMFTNFILRGVPTIIVHMLCFWYRSQQLCMQWCKTRSCFFTLFNGVQQGGIPFPKLFFVYMDDLSNLLISSGIVMIKINLSNFPLYLYSSSPGAYCISITLYYINKIGGVELDRVEYRLLSSSVS